MDRVEQILAVVEPLFGARFQQSARKIEAYCAGHGAEVAGKTVTAFQNVFSQVSKLQVSGAKGAVRHLVLSHLYRGVYTGCYAVKIDLFDRRFYADRAEVDARLRLGWLNPFLDEDMAFFRQELVKHFASLRKYELEQVRYKYIGYYHAAVLRYLQGIISSLMRLSEFQTLELEPDIEVLFGGYMDKAVVIWRAGGAVDGILSN